MDLLTKLEVSDNVSYYNEGHGRKDVTLAFVWDKKYDRDAQLILSSTKVLEVTEKSVARREITIDDCFNEFKKPEILDE